MFGECHAHLIMDGIHYKKAVAQHEHGVVDEPIRERLQAYAQRGIRYVRDGGDARGVSQRAAVLAQEYGITLRTPLFAIHRRGHYGGIVGLPYDDLKEYRELVARVRAQGGHFIKLMVSGIMDFNRMGQLTEPSLEREEIRELIHIAHEEGFAVMVHVNGADAIRYVVEAGADSVEHGNFADEDALQALAGSRTVWVPTFVTITSLIGCGRFDDGALKELKHRQGERIRRGFALGACIALGSDAGAYRVYHGSGLEQEYREIKELLTLPGKSEGEFRLTQPELDRRLELAEKRIRELF